jgi:hypothetical protein
MRAILIYMVLAITALLFSNSSYAQTVTDQQQVLYLRRLQLLGKFNTNYSFQQRNIIAEQTSIPTIIKDFSFGDIIPQKKQDTTNNFFRLLPLNKWDVYNTHHPITINDAEMIPSVGYQTLITTGIFYKKNHWTAQLKPVFQFTENKPYETFYTEFVAQHWHDYYQWINKIDLPERFGSNPINKLNPGQSYLKYNFKNAAIGISTENMWWGPGYYQSLLMTNNAPGFLHLTYESKHPLKTIFGSVEWQVITGLLNNSNIEPLEPRRVFNGQFLYQPKLNEQRIISGATVSFQPKFLEGLHIGFAKTAYLYTTDAKSPLDYLPLFGFYGLKTTAAEKNKRKQIMGSLFFRYQMKNENAEVYAELGRNDKTMSPLFFMDDAAAPTAFVAGFRKMFPLKKETSFELAAEFTQLGFNSVNLINNVQSWYLSDTVRHGYTNNGKVIGSGIGPGSNSQLIELAYNNGIDRISLQLERRIHNNDFFYYTFARILDFRRHWTDAMATVKIDKTYKNFLFGGSVTMMRTLNYQWMYKEYDAIWYKNGLDFLTLQGQLYFHYRFNLKK